MDLQLFIPITKVDVARRLVYGTIAEEIPDRSGEIMDYETARPEFESWSAEIAKASSGKSAGNLRAMHGSVAAGRLDQILFDDVAKRISTVAKVVDDGEWKKVLEGVYTGFSMGGRYKKRWRDTGRPELTRYTPEPMEVSLVDNPCIPSATFEVVKDDGSIELRKFRSLEKYGARNSREDLARLQAIHDTAVALGAGCDGNTDAGDTGTGDTGDDNSNDDMTGKFARAGMVALVRRAVAESLRDLSRRVEKLEALPMPGGAVTRSVSKAFDARGLDAGDAVTQFERHLEKLAPAERAHALAKLALKNPLAR